MKDNLLLPIQVEYLIKNLLDTKQSIHIRNNYKYSLENIRTAINQSISDFDRQTNTDKMFTAKKKR